MYREEGIETRDAARGLSKEKGCGKRTSCCSLKEETNNLDQPQPGSKDNFGACLRKSRQFSHVSDNCAGERFGAHATYCTSQKKKTVQRRKKAMSPPPLHRCDARSTSTTADGESKKSTPSIQNAPWQKENLPTGETNRRRGVISCSSLESDLPQAASQAFPCHGEAVGHGAVPHDSNDGQTHEPERPLLADAAHLLRVG